MIPLLKFYQYIFRYNGLYIIFDKLLFIPLVCLCVFIAGCSDEADPVPDVPAALNVFAYTDALDSKGLITANTLDADSELGVTVVDAGGANYAGLDYTNVSYKATGSGETQTWGPTAGEGILLTGEVGTVYAYYPYQADQTITALPIDATTDTDYMYADPYGPVNSIAATAKLKLKHALAAVRLTVKANSSFTGTGALSQVSVTSTALGNVGSLNCKTGAVTASDAGTACVRTATHTINTIGKNFDLLVIPTGEAADLQIALAIDDKSYEVTVPNASIVQGKVNCWTLTVGRTSLIVEGSTVAGWAVVNDPNNYVSGPSTVILNQGTVVSYNDVIDNTVYVAYRN